MSRKNWIRTRISRAGEQRAGPHLIRHGACGRRAATPSPPGEGLGDGGATSSVTALAGDAPRHLLLQEKAWGGGHPYRPDGHFPQRGKQERGHLIRTSVSPSNAWRYGHLLLQEKAWGTGEPPHPSRRLRETRRDTFSSRRRLGGEQERGSPLRPRPWRAAAGGEGSSSSAPRCSRGSSPRDSPGPPAAGCWPPGG